MTRLTTDGLELAIATQRSRKLSDGAVDVTVAIDGFIDLCELAMKGLTITRPEAASASKLPSLPDEIQEWCWHMDLHVTEHDERHAAMALRSAWPHVSKWLQANVGPSSKAGVPFAPSPPLARKPE